MVNLQNITDFLNGIPRAPYILFHFSQYNQLVTFLEYAILSGSLVALYVLVIRT